MAQIVRLSVGDVIELKKPHPCGGRHFDVMRVGSDIRIICRNCKRDVTVPRLKLEKNIKTVINGEKENNDG